LEKQQEGWGIEGIGPQNWDGLARGTKARLNSTPSLTPQNWDGLANLLSSG